MSDDIFIKQDQFLGQQPFISQTVVDAQSYTSAQQTYRISKTGQTPFTYINRTPTPARSSLDVQTPSTYQHRSPLTYQHRSPLTYDHRSPLTYNHRSPFTYANRQPSTYNHRSPYRSPFTYQHRSPFIYQHQSPLIVQISASKQSPFTYQHREPNSYIAQTPLTYEHRSPLIYQHRSPFQSPSTYQHRSPFIYNTQTTFQSPFTYQHRDPSTYQHRSPSTYARQGQTPVIYQHRSPLAYTNADESAQTTVNYNHRSPFITRQPSIYQHQSPSVYQHRSPGQNPSIYQAQIPFTYQARQPVASQLVSSANKQTTVSASKQSPFIGNTQAPVSVNQPTSGFLPVVQTESVARASELITAFGTITTGTSGMPNDINSITIGSPGVAGNIGAMSIVGTNYDRDRDDFGGLSSADAAAGFEFKVQYTNTNDVRILVRETNSSVGGISLRPHTSRIGNLSSSSSSSFSLSSGNIDATNYTEIFKLTNIGANRAQVKVNWANPAASPYSCVWPANLTGPYWRAFADSSEMDFDSDKIPCVPVQWPRTTLASPYYTLQSGTSGTAVARERFYYAPGPAGNNITPSYTSLGTSSNGSTLVIGYRADCSETFGNGSSDVLDGTSTIMELIIKDLDSGTEHTCDLLIVFPVAVKADSEPADEGDGEEV